MPYRTDLKRPDLKGQFPCSVCNKVFCHSSSLSRHRMQAHYKCYICTQCNQEIHSSETLRSHMFRCHQIQRMFMCRCCNWAFPDKTSLHIHMQSMQKSGMPGDVSVLARSSLEKSEMAAAEAAMGSRSFGSPSNSSPDEEHFRDDSMSPYISEAEEEHGGEAGHFHQNHQLKMEEAAQPPSLLPQITAGIFPTNQFESTPAELLFSKFGIKTEHQEEKGQPHLQQQQQQQPTISPAMFHQQWFAQFLANNPHMLPAVEPKNHVQSTHFHLHQQQDSSRVIQSLCAALASAAAFRAGNLSRLNTPQMARETQQLPCQAPPQKKPRKSEKRKDDVSTSQENLSLQIPHLQGAFPAVSPALSEGQASGKLNSLISNLLSIRGGSVHNNSMGEEEEGKTSANVSTAERKNKRKLRTPTRAAEMAEMIYDDDEPKKEKMPGQCASLKSFCAQQLAGKCQGDGGTDDSDQQPSPAVSDSQTSGSSSGCYLDAGLTSPKKCDCCQRHQQAKLCAAAAENVANGAAKKVRGSGQRINEVAERISSLADSLQDEGTKEGLLTCVHQLQAIAKGQ